jgi:hypothetical protein
MTTLKNVLLINALSSGATGIGLIFFAQFVAELFGTSHVHAIWGTGLFLLGFAILVFYVSRQHQIKPRGVLVVTTLDTLWVASSLIIVLFQLFDLSFTGYFFITAVALWVAAMAYLQSTGLKKVAGIQS